MGIVVYKKFPLVTLVIFFAFFSTGYDTVSTNYFLC